jgi:hypothetical protein
MFAFLAATMVAQPNLGDWNNVKALATGTDVRATTGSRTVHGKILRSTDDSLVLAFGKSQEMFTRQEITRVSLRGDSHRARNSLIGLAGGATIGAIIGAKAHQDCTGFCILYLSKGTDMALGAVVLGGIGAAIGALLPTRSWLEVYRQ